MKSLKLLFVLMFFIVNGLQAQDIDIIDATFLKYLINSGYDLNKDGKIQKNEGLNIVKIEIYEPYITSLKGIEEFKNLEKLDMVSGVRNGNSFSQFNTYIDSLDLSFNNKLKFVSFNCYYYKYVKLGQMPDLETLVCDSDNINIIDYSIYPKLFYFHLNSKYLKSIDISKNFFLKDFVLSSDYINNIDLTNNVLLEKLNLYLGKLEEINLSNNKLLNDVNFQTMSLKSIDLSKNNLIEKFILYSISMPCISFDKNNIIETIYIFGPFENINTCNLYKLKNFWVGSNLLYNLDFSNSLDLEYFMASGCESLIELNVSTCKNLKSINCVKNTNINSSIIKICLPEILQTGFINTSTQSFEYSKNCSKTCPFITKINSTIDKLCIFNDAVIKSESITNSNSVKKYIWQLNSENIFSDSDTLNFRFNKSGTWKVNLIVDYACFKDTSNAILISVDSLPLKPNLGDSILCFSSPQTLNAGIGYTNYLWNTGSTNSSILINKSGDYNVKVSNTCGFISDTISVKVKEKLLQLNANRVCKTDTTHFTYSSTEPIYNYHWAYGNNATATTNQTKYKYPKAGTYNANLVVDYYCFKDTANTQVIIDDTPILNIGDSIITCSYDAIELNAGAGFVSYLWQDGSKNQNYSAIQSGIYTVSVSNTCGTQTDSVTIKKVQLDIPNIITPNNDDLNEALQIESQLPNPIYLNIVNRWGGEVFNATNYQNNWDANGLSDGMYYYTSNYEGCEAVKGWVQVVR